MKTLILNLLMALFVAGFQGKPQSENFIQVKGNKAGVELCDTVRKLHETQMEKNRTLQNYLIPLAGFLNLLAIGIVFQILITRKSRERNRAFEQQARLNLHRINNATGKFVPNEFLRAIGRENLSDVLLGDHVEKIVTVLFADIRDYTGLAEQMTPEENFKFVNAFNRRMGPIIQEMNGFVNQYLGDGIMAIFPHSPADALQAAVKMQQVLEVYNHERAGKNRRAIKIGIGMHTGSLIMGIIGDQNRMDAATISDAVNTAARIESLTKYYGASILLSKTCLDMMPDDQKFNLRYLGEVKVRGREKATGIYECFDSNPPEVMQSKINIQNDFEMGTKHFFAKAFPEAILAFRRILQENKNDFVAQHFYKRSSTLALNGVPDNWSGVEEIFSK